jgi:hypothetical protein
MGQAHNEYFNEELMLALIFCFLNCVKEIQIMDRQLRLVLSPHLLSSLFVQTCLGPPSCCPSACLIPLVVVAFA